jgi:basic membrane lipoprotein Med (substrate-binding protein (PBP1-ABC) superfamily)
MLARISGSMQERSLGYIFGVDQDWTLTNPQYSAQILGSVLKKMDVPVYETVKLMTEGAGSKQLPFFRRQDTNLYSIQQLKYQLLKQKYLRSFLVRFPHFHPNSLPHILAPNLK